MAKQKPRRISITHFLSDMALKRPVRTIWLMLAGRRGSSVRRGAAKSIVCFPAVSTSVANATIRLRSLREPSCTAAV